jgi:hypothetical protein
MTLTNDEQEQLAQLLGCPPGHKVTKSELYGWVNEPVSVGNGQYRRITLASMFMKFTDE